MHATRCSETSAGSAAVAAEVTTSRAWWRAKMQRIARRDADVIFAGFEWPVSEPCSCTAIWNEALNLGISSGGAVTWLWPRLWLSASS